VTRSGESPVRQHVRKCSKKTAAAVVVAVAASMLSVTQLVPTLARADTPGLTVPSVPAQQPGLTLNCAAGQIDLNHASTAQLQTLPDVPGPVASRIIALRPNDRTNDLLAVPGIGPTELAAIQASGKACSTPLTLPPPAANVCTVNGQLDMNDPASKPGLAQLFGSPTAARIVGAEPFPDLAHAMTVLAAGAGPGKVTKRVRQ
jgi:DNA uptake protein ComE-like DNA-binding protein